MHISAFIDNTAHTNTVHTNAWSDAHFLLSAIWRTVNENVSEATYQRGVARVLNAATCLLSSGG
ncbi:hypothetical protein M3J09_004097 [Ascochyta lentis]